MNFERTGRAIKRDRKYKKIHNIQGRAWFGYLQIQLSCSPVNRTTGIKGQDDGICLPVGFIKYSPYRILLVNHSIVNTNTRTTSTSQVKIY